MEAFHLNSLADECITAGVLADECVLQKSIRPT